MEIPEDLRYHPEHHWARRDGDLITVGITDFAQEELGEVVYVSLPELGSTVTKDEFMCELESNKTASDVYAPMSGEVVEVNDSIVSSPETLNSDPYGDGWMIRVRARDPGEWDALLDAASYAQLVGGQAH